MGREDCFCGEVPVCRPAQCCASYFIVASHSKLLSTGVLGKEEGKIVLKPVMLQKHLHFHHVCTRLL